MVKVPSVELSNGIEMPVIGLGTYARKAVPGQYRQAVEWGIELGYRHIDTASSYHNEEEVGQGINSMIQNGTVTREQLFVTTKLWNDQHKKENVVPALKESLCKLNLDYVDLFLIHWPFSVDAKGQDCQIDYLETWQGMEECVKLGLTRSIGVSNFNETQLQRILDNCTVKPVVNQVEISPTLTQQGLSQWLLSHNIVPVAYTPLGLISDARPEYIHLAAIASDEKLEKLAKSKGKSKAQIALRYLHQRGIVVIPKSFTKSRIEENINIFDFELNSEEMALLESFNINHRCVPANPFKIMKNYPF